jgi:hypothetical protein
MNLENTMNLLGTLQTMLAVLKQLPDGTRQSVLGTMRSNGIDPERVSKHVVKCKHALQAIPAANFEPMAAIAAGHLEHSARVAILNEPLIADGWGAVLYANDYGAFLHVDASAPPSHGVPQSLRDLHAWGVEAGLCWIKLDRDAAPIASLNRYDDIQDVRAVLASSDVGAQA